MVVRIGVSGQQPQMRRPLLVHLVDDALMRVHEREPIGAALRRFKKLIERSGMKGELRAHEYYEKPCEARRRKEARRKNAIRKAASMPRT